MVYVYSCVCVECVAECVNTCTVRISILPYRAWVWRSEDTLGELVSFYLIEAMISFLSSLCTRLYGTLLPCLPSCHKSVRIIDTSHNHLWLFLSSEDWILVTGFAWQSLHPLSHLTSPSTTFCTSIFFWFFSIIFCLSLSIALQRFSNYLSLKKKKALSPPFLTRWMLHTLACTAFLTQHPSSLCTVS